MHKVKTIDDGGLSLVIGNSAWCKTKGSRYIYPVHCRDGLEGGALGTLST